MELVDQDYLDVYLLKNPKKSELNRYFYYVSEPPFIAVFQNGVTNNHKIVSFDSSSETMQELLKKSRDSTILRELGLASSGTISKPTMYTISKLELSQV